MLARLMHLHQEVIDRLERFERIIEGQAPERDALVDIRDQLVRAGIARTRFLEAEVYPFLAACLPADERVKVGQLEAETARARLLASTRYSLWSTDKAIRNWPTFVLTAKGAAAALRKRIATEKAQIYPLLARCLEGPAPPPA